MFLQLRTISLVLFIGWSASVSCQSIRTFSAYLSDRAILTDMGQALHEGRFREGDSLAAAYSDRTNPAFHYLSARLKAAQGYPFAEHLDSAMSYGLRLEGIDMEDPFFIEHKAEVESRYYKYNGLASPFHEDWTVGSLIAVDQFLNADDMNEEVTPLNKANLKRLDDLIERDGWPTSRKVRNFGPGAALILAHQPYFGPAEFDHYAGLITEQCEKGREDWSVLLFVLQQRIRRLAREKPDTISISEDFRTGAELPMLAAISERLTANGHKHATLSVRSTVLGVQLSGFLVALQPEIQMDPETLAYLIARNHDHPAPLTTDRIAVIVNPELRPDVVLYQMD